jgi:hypothetical protein
MDGNRCAVMPLYCVLIFVTFGNERSDGTKHQLTPTINPRSFSPRRVCVFTQIRCIYCNARLKQKDNGENKYPNKD